MSCEGGGGGGSGLTPATVLAHFTGEGDTELSVHAGDTVWLQPEASAAEGSAALEWVLAFKCASPTAAAKRGAGKGFGYLPRSFLGLQSAAYDSHVGHAHQPVARTVVATPQTSQECEPQPGAAPAKSVSAQRARDGGDASKRAAAASTIDVYAAGVREKVAGALAVQWQAPDSPASLAITPVSLPSAGTPPSPVQEVRGSAHLPVLFRYSVNHRTIPAPATAYPDVSMAPLDQEVGKEVAGVEMGAVPSAMLVSSLPSVPPAPPGHGDEAALSSTAEGCKPLVSVVQRDTLLTDAVGLVALAASVMGERHGVHINEAGATGCGDLAAAEEPSDVACLPGMVASSSCTTLPVNQVYAASVSPASPTSHVSDLEPRSGSVVTLRSGISSATAAIRSSVSGLDVAALLAAGTLRNNTTTPAPVGGTAMAVSAAGIKPSPTPLLYSHDTSSLSAASPPRSPAAASVTSQAGSVTFEPVPQQQQQQQQLSASPTYAAARTHFKLPPAWETNPPVTAAYSLGYIDACARIRSLIEQRSHPIAAAAVEQVCAQLPTSAAHLLTSASEAARIAALATVASVVADVMLRQSEVLDMKVMQWEREMAAAKVPPSPSRELPPSPASSRSTASTASTAAVGLQTFTPSAPPMMHTLHSSTGASLPVVLGPPGGVGFAPPARGRSTVVSRLITAPGGAPASSLLRAPTTASAMAATTPVYADARMGGPGVRSVRSTVAPPGTGATPTASGGPAWLPLQRGESSGILFDFSRPPATAPLTIASAVSGLTRASNIVQLVSEAGSTPSRLPASRSASAPRYTAGAAAALSAGNLHMPYRSGYTPAPMPYSTPSVPHTATAARAAVAGKSYTNRSSSLPRSLVY